MDNQVFANTSGKLSIYIIAVIFFFTSALDAQTPNTMLEVEGEISANGVIVGTTNGNAPGSMRFNPTNNRFEGYNGSEWLPLDFGEGQQAWTDSLSYIYRQTSRVGIGTATPDSSALLDLSSDAKGFLLPRMTTSQRNAITLPAQGLQIYNTDDGCLDIHIDTSWLKNCATSITYDSTKIWRQKTDVGGNGRYGAVGFSIGGKGYIGTGIGGSGNLKDFWEYDPLTDVWTQKADFWGSARRYSVGFSIGGKGYIGTGFGGSGNLKDFWEYDPLTDVWTQKADFGGSARRYSVGFSIGGKGYIGTGNGAPGVFKDFWEYDPLADVWTQKADFGGTARNASVGFSIGGKGYIGTGFGISGNLKDFWEYDPLTDVWTQKADFGGSARNSSVGFSIGEKGYIGTGHDGSSDLNDFWEYDPIADVWTQKADLGGIARSISVGFSIGDKGYIGTGNDGSSHFNDFWEYDYSLAPFGGYLLADGQIAFNSIPKWNGTALTSSSITDNGINVGIGETAPDGKLTVLDDQQNAITLKTSDNAQNNGIAFQNSLNGYTWNIFRDNVGGNLADFVISGGNANADLNLLTPRFRITKDGDIGIGKLPATKLDVEGAITATGGSSTDWNTAFGWGDHNTQGYLTTFSETDPKVGAIAFNRVPKWNGTKLTSSLITDDGVRVGVGTTTPDGKLTVLDTSQNAITLKTSNNTQNNGIAFQNSLGAYTWNIFRANVGGNQADFVISGGNAESDVLDLPERFRITKDGDIGIGKIPTAKLDVEGTIATTNLSATDTITTTDLSATGTITANDLSASGAINFVDVNASGAITTTNLSVTDTITATDLSATGTITANDLSASGAINFVDVNASGAITTTNLSATGTITANDLRLNQKPVVDVYNPIELSVAVASTNFAITTYTPTISVISGDFITMHGNFFHRFTTGSGPDPLEYRVFAEGSGGCPNVIAHTVGPYVAAEGTADHDNYAPLTYLRTFTTACTGSYRFRIELTNLTGTDDAALVKHRTLVVRKN